LMRLMVSHRTSISAKVNLNSLINAVTGSLEY
jgi:hypothetical protein